MGICKVKKSAQFDFDKYQKEFGGLIKHAHKELQFSKPFKLMFVSEPDADKEVFCKTGAYSPTMGVIFLYVRGRHIKDILRSLAHEMVHHHQNCQGSISKDDKDYDEGYAQRDQEARRLEEDAYLRGNMIFRDWEDGAKSDREKLMDEHAKINLDEDDVEEASVAANVAGYQLPLGASNFNRDPESKSKNRVK